MILPGIPFSYISLKYSGYFGANEDILKVDTSSLIKSTNKEMKTLLFNLNKVMSSGDEMHQVINENYPSEIEVFEDIVVNLKINLRDRNPPGTVTFTYIRGKDLHVYGSKTCKDPNDENNQGKYSNVRSN